MRMPSLNNCLNQIVCAISFRSYTIIDTPDSHVLLVFRHIWERSQKCYCGCCLIQLLKVECDSSSVHLAWRLARMVYPSTKARVGGLAVCTSYGSFCFSFTALATLVCRHRQILIYSSLCLVIYDRLHLQWALVREFGAAWREERWLCCSLQLMLSILDSTSCRCHARIQICRQFCTTVIRRTHVTTPCHVFPTR